MKLGKQLSDFEQQAGGHLIAVHTQVATEETRGMQAKYAVTKPLVISSPSGDMIKWFGIADVYVDFLRNKFPGGNVLEIDGGWLVLDARERLQDFVDVRENEVSRNEDEQGAVAAQAE